MDLESKLKNLLIQAKIELEDDQIKKLIGLVELLNKWNKAYNLTSIKDPNEMLVKHILDSLVVSKYLKGNLFIDVGTGPGLPGLPLAIVNPDKQFYLLDSLGKRIRFIKQVCHELKVKNVVPIQSRVEEFNPTNKFDGVLSRAFTSLTNMVDWCEHLPNENGKFYALKGQIPDEIDLNNLPSNINIEQIFDLVVPELNATRSLVVLSCG